MKIPSLCPKPIMRIMLMGCAVALLIHMMARRLSERADFLTEQKLAYATGDKS